MDQLKTGKYIAQCRKEQGLTQAALAEQLGISDRAVSKWETGKSLPDSGIMLELCELLNINVNELLSGEKIMEGFYDKHAEENLLAMRKEIDERDRLMLRMEYWIGIPTIVIWLVMCAVVNYVEMPKWIGIVIMVFGLVMVLSVGSVLMLIEQRAGFYQCQNCSHKYVPTYWKVFFAPHVGRTRYLTCPQCAQRSWHRKVLSSDEIEQQ